MDKVFKRMFHKPMYTWTTKERDLALSNPRATLRRLGFRV